VGRNDKNPGPLGRGDFKSKEKSMNKAFYEKLKQSAEAALKEGDGFIIGETKPLTVENKVNASGNVTKDITFDSAGDAGFSMSKYCAGRTVNISGSINGGPGGAVYNLTIDTNHPEHFNWNGIQQGQVIVASLKTNWVGKTDINAFVHSSVPGSNATVSLHYST
jgi:hypothetical protein